MPDELDAVQERVDADTERAVAARPRYTGHSAEHCIDCGDAIAEARRSQLPGVQTCVECQALRERAR